MTGTNISDFIKLDYQAKFSQSVGIHLTPNNTPLKLELWGKYLYNHPDKDLVAYNHIFIGIKQGFRTGVNSTYNLISATKNMH